MDFISERESFRQDAEEEQASNLSSYMLSSRASRRKLQHSHEPYDAEEEIQIFKDQIEKKFTASVTNKIYTFPFSAEAYDHFDDDDKELRLLQDKSLLCLFQKQIDSNHFDVAIKHQKAQAQTSIIHLLEAIKIEQERITNLASYIQLNSAAKASQTRQLKGTVQRKPKEQIEDSLRKRLYTEPYEKPLGFIIKKK